MKIMKVKVVLFCFSSSVLFHFSVITFLGEKNKNRKNLGIKRPMVVSISP